MKYIFFGTSEFSAIILEKLIKNGFAPTLVVCNPDKPTGRKKILTPPPVKITAQKYSIPISQPETIKKWLFHQWKQPKKDNNLCNTKISITKQNLLSIQDWDFFLVAAYAQILPKEILALPKFGTVNLHPSLLPKHRGSSPIQTALLNGDKEIGVTLFLMDEKVDHGPILAKQELEIPNSKFQIPNKSQNAKSKTTYIELNKELAELGAELLIKTLPKFLKGEITPQPQDESQSTYTKKFKTEDGCVDYDALKQALNGSSPKKAGEIEKKIRALNPEPGVYAFINKKRTKLLEAEIIDGTLKISKIQIEGKTPINCANIRI